MDIQRWEQICRDSKMRPEKMYQTDIGTIYLADGYFNSHPEFPEPHYKTLWAVAKGKMDIAQPLYFKFGGGVTLEQRIQKAAETAWEFLND